MRGSVIIAALAALTASCSQECPEGLLDCSRSHTLLCVDVLGDHENCGECGSACEPGHICEEGVCTLSCPEGHTECSGVCRDLMTDNFNCGWCGLFCGWDHECIDGWCEPL